MKIYSELQTITPSMATAYLEKNTGNRTLSWALIRQYAEDMKNGTWDLTSQGISFCEDGSLQDGQHRLNAIIKANIPVEMYVSFNCPKTSHIDRQRARSTFDSIRIGYGAGDITRKMVDVVKLLSSKCSYDITTDSEKYSFIMEYKPDLEFSCEIYKCNERFLSSCFINAGIFLAKVNGVPKEKLLRFSQVLASGYCDSESEQTIVCLRNWLIHSVGMSTRGGTQRWESLGRVCWTINKFDKGECCHRIILPEKFVYSIPSIRKEEQPC